MVHAIINVYATLPHRLATAPRLATGSSIAASDGQTAKMNVISVSGRNQWASGVKRISNSDVAALKN